MTMANIFLVSDVSSTPRRLIKANADTLTYIDAFDTTFIGISPYGCCSDGVYAWVADFGGDEILKIYLPTMEVVYIIGSTGTGNDEFNGPYDIAYDGTHLYITDYYNDRVVKRLASDLSYVDQYGTTGSGNDQLSTPVSVETDGTYIYISDIGNYRIVKRLCSDLTYVDQVGSVGAPFGYPIEQICHDNGYLYVMDPQNDRILKFGTDLSFITAHGTFGTGNDNLNAARGITSDGTYLYVVDSYNGRIVKKNIADFSYVSEVNNLNGALVLPWYVTFVVETPTPQPSADELLVGDEDNVIVISRNPTDLSFVSSVGVLGVTGNDYTHFNYPSGLAVDDTFVYISDYTNCRIIKRLATDLSYISAIGTYGTGNDQFINPQGIAYADGYLYIIEKWGYRLQKRLASDLSYDSKIGSQGTGDDQFGFWPFGCAAYGSYVYVSDPGNDRVHKRSVVDLSLDSFITYNMDEPLGLHCDGTYLWVVDGNSVKVSRFLLSTDAFVDKIDVFNGSDTFGYPTDVTTDGTYLYVMDAGNYRIVKFTISTMAYHSEIGMEGYSGGPNEFGWCESIALIPGAAPPEPPGPIATLTKGTIIW